MHINFKVTPGMKLSRGPVLLVLRHQRGGWGQKMAILDNPKVSNKPDGTQFEVNFGSALRV